jgi:hypothetical protein
MLRFASRFLGFWLLAAAVVAGVVDGAKSIAASALVTTSLGDAWSLVAGLGSGEAQDAAATAPPSLPALLEIPLHWLLALPAVAVLGIAGAVFLILGAKRRPPSLSREFAA